MRDIAYFLSTSVTPELRRSIEREAIEEYHRTLCAADVTNFDLEECWSLYRNLMLTCLVGPVITCGSLDIQDQGSREMLEVGLERTFAAVQELNAEEFLLGRPRVFSMGSIGAGLSIGMYKARRGIR